MKDGMVIIVLFLFNSKEIEYNIVQLRKENSFCQFCFSRERELEKTEIKGELAVSQKGNKLKIKRFYFDTTMISEQAMLTETG